MSEFSSLYNIYASILNLRCQLIYCFEFKYPVPLLSFLDKDSKKPWLHANIDL